MCGNAAQDFLVNLPPATTALHGAVDPSPRRNEVGPGGYAPSQPGFRGAWRVDSGEMARRLCRPPGSPLEDDDLLAEILLRLPPLPSSLPRASSVCKRWRGTVSDPHFLHRFRAHHRKPPLLGFITHDMYLKIEFTPALDPPDRIPADRFSPRLDDAVNCKIFSCHHGRVLILNKKQSYFIAWDPVTGDQRRKAFPAAFRGEDGKTVKHGAVVCRAGEQGHVHGACHSSPFQVLLLASDWHGCFACVYSSETGEWGSVVSLLMPHNVHGVASHCPITLVGGSICCMLEGRNYGILEFDLSRQSLSAIEIPSGVADLITDICYNEQYLIVPADGGGLNFIVLSGFRARRVWNRKAGCNTASGWLLINTIDLCNLLSLKPGPDTRPPKILTDLDNDMLIWTDVGVFLVNVESMQFKKVCNWTYNFDNYHPFTSFYCTGHIAEATQSIGTVNPSERS